jgi:hypothetical protein
MTTNDARCTREIKSRIAMAEAAFNKKTLLLTIVIYRRERDGGFKNGDWGVKNV